MSEAHKFAVGVRKPEDEHRYRSVYDDPRIRAHMVSPTVEGYYRLPAIWVGIAPTDAEQSTLNPSVHHQHMVQRTLKCGIKVKALRNGLFLFDFQRWARGPTILIPGYTIDDPTQPHVPPKAHSEADSRAEEIAMVRAQAMNVHQACLATAERTIMRRSAGMGLPITPWNAYKAIRLNLPVHYREDTEDLRSFAQNAMDNHYRHGRARPLHRRVIEQAVVEESYRLLDEILTHKSDATLVLVDSLYQAANRSHEKRFGESITLAWTVCEQLVFYAWKEHLADISNEPVARIGKARREKLLGRDYTASVMVESLELLGILDHDLYRRLEIVRKARNKWAHDLRLPKESEVSVGIRAASDMLGRLMGIYLHLQYGGRGGVPAWGVTYLPSADQEEILSG